nr:hypothetical protein [Tanacetum cinerariifolium]
DEYDDVFIEATPIGTKVPVVNYEIVMINNKPRYKIIRADDTHQLYTNFITLLKNFDREDLEDLWKIVKARFSTSKPTNFSDDYLLVTLNTMFEKTDAQDVIWRSQQTEHGLRVVKLQFVLSPEAWSTRSPQAIDPYSLHSPSTWPHLDMTKLSQSLFSHLVDYRPLPSNTSHYRFNQPIIPTRTISSANIKQHMMLSCIPLKTYRESRKKCTASEIWKQLVKRFSLSDGSRKYKLNKDTYEITQSGSFVGEYYTKMKSVWEELYNINVLLILAIVTPEISVFLEVSQRLLFKSSTNIESSALLSKGVVKEKCSIYGFKWHPPKKRWEKVGYLSWHSKYKGPQQSRQSRQGQSQG